MYLMLSTKITNPTVIKNKGLNFTLKNSKLNGEILGLIIAYDSKVYAHKNIQRYENAGFES